MANNIEGGGGAKSSMGIGELQFTKKSSEKEGGDWFEPFLDVHTPSPRVVFVCLKLSSQKLFLGKKKKKYWGGGHLASLTHGYLDLKISAE